MSDGDPVFETFPPEAMVIVWSLEVKFVEDVIAVLITISAATATVEKAAKKQIAKVANSLIFIILNV